MILSNCTNSRMFSRETYGDWYLSGEAEKDYIFPMKNQKIKANISNSKRISGHASQTFRKGGLKKRHEKKL